MVLSRQWADNEDKPLGGTMVISAVQDGGFRRLFQAGCMWWPQRVYCRAPKGTAASYGCGVAVAVG
jgi:hypothetical protein